MTAFVLLLAMMFAPFSALAKETSWDGEYRYAHKAGKTAGGSNIVVTYEIMLSSPPEPSCSVSIVGFQSNEWLMCTPQIDKDGLTLKFRFYETGKVTNQYDVAVYKVGEPLLRLSRGQDGKLTTTWLGILAKDEAARPTGKYFVQTKAYKTRN
jgi:hypothetical protein